MLVAALVCSTISAGYSSYPEDVWSETIPAKPPHMGAAHSKSMHGAMGAKVTHCADMQCVFYGSLRQVEASSMEYINNALRQCTVANQSPPLPYTTVTVTQLTTEVDVRAY